MDRVTRCLHVGKRMVAAPSFSGRTELQCVFCDNLDPLKIEAAKWADSHSPRHYSDRDNPPNAVGRYRSF